MVRLSVRLLREAAKDVDRNVVFLRRCFSKLSVNMHITFIRISLTFGIFFRVTDVQRRVRLNCLNCTR